MPGTLNNPGGLVINGNYVQNASGIFDVQLGTSNGLLTINGDGKFSGDLRLNALTSFIPTVGEIFTIAMVSGSYSVNFAGIPGNIFSDNRGDIFQLNSVFANGYNHMNLTVNSVAAVPVPAAAWLFGSVLFGFVGFNRHKSA